ncbi:hypothetical protein POM88_002142 [Heracleum sosnowskyi]|uniref:Uncharacterized protein n=1 Tax=Heracleum sosnowskyi TaxID=360622 RepID=A0AAD8JHG0_9APIA|nr:hypothetical protein POM88_002142 [Heracleum sosnowskyi]
MAKLGPSNFKSSLSLCSNQPHPQFESGWKECPPSSDKGMLPPTIKGKAQRGGGEMRRGEEKAFGDRYFLCFSSKTKKAEDGLRCVLSEGNTLFQPRRYDCRALSSFRPLAYWDSSLRALPALFNRIKNYGSARKCAGNNRKEGIHVASAPSPS